MKLIFVWSNKLGPAMSTIVTKIPTSIKAPLIFIGLIAFVFVLYIAKGIIIPLVFATIIAIVLHPVVNLFVRFTSKTQCPCFYYCCNWVCLFVGYSGYGHSHPTYGYCQTHIRPRGVTRALGVFIGRYYAATF